MILHIKYGLRFDSVSKVCCRIFKLPFTKAAATTTTTELTRMNTRMNALGACMLGALALAVTANTATAQTTTQDTALNCGKLFDARAGKVLGAHTILVREGKIAQVSPGHTNIANVHTVDLTAHTCLPGWADLHVHLGGESSPQSYSEGFRLDPVDYAYRSIGYAEKTLMAGFTSVRDLGGEISPHLRDAINQGLVDGPRIFAAGKGITTTGGHGDPTNGLNTMLTHLYGPPGPTEGVINSVDDARQAVRQRYKNGSDVIKITATGGVLSYAKSGDAPLFTIDEIRSIVETAKDYGYAVAAHAHGTEGMRRAVVAGVTSIEHGTYMTPEVMRLMREKGTWFVPTIYAGKFVEGKSKVPGYFPAIVQPKAAAIGPLMQKTAGDAYRAGVKIAFGTDQGVGPHGDNAREFLYMVEAGIPAAYSLQAATIHAATVLGVDDMGLLEVGKRADIIAVPGDPVEDINVVMDVRFVMKEGRIYKQM